MITKEMLDELHKLDPLRKAPLTRRVLRHDDGSPIKTPLALEFPLLSRRQRRLLQKNRAPEIVCAEPKQA